MRQRLWTSMALATLGALTGCVPETDPETRYETIQWPLEAFCTAEVLGVGDRDVETDYLAHVVSCENGGADLEALKAQAVSARTYLYFKLETSGSIADGTSDQVYTCNRPPGQEHFEAVLDTSGEVLRDAADDVTLAAFYVAGAIPSTDDCLPLPSDPDPTNTERFVTYNEGLSGAAVEPSSLGHPGNPRNRGCKSQNGAHCLAEKGWQHQDILRFYYGEDVEFVIAEGACVEDPSPDALPDANPDALPDANPDALPDANPDALPDANPDALPDANPDALPDANPDAAPGQAPEMAAPPLDDAVRVTRFRESCSTGPARPGGGTHWWVFTLLMAAGRVRQRREARP